MYDTDWRTVKETPEEIFADNEPHRIMDFTPTTLMDESYTLGPGVRERLTNSFNHCWAIATHDSPECHRGRTGVAISYSKMKARVLFGDGTSGKVHIRMLYAARPNWSGCAECANELYIVIDEDLSNFSTIGRRVWDHLVPLGSPKIQLEFKSSTGRSTTKRR